MRKKTNIIENNNKEIMNNEIYDKENVETINEETEENIEDNNDSVLVSVKKQLIKGRKRTRQTQKEIADKMGTKTSNISRFENLSNTNSPTIDTIIKYANAVNMRVDIKFTKNKNNQ